MQVPREPSRWRRSLGAAVCGLALLASAACSKAADNAPLLDPVVTHTTNSSSPGPVVALPGSLAADFTSLLPTLGGHAGMAIMAVGSDTATSMGDWTSGPAWSTMKVPLTLAVLNTNGNTPSYAMSAAITESDNNAADSLWQSLGTGDQAAQAVQKVLQQGGDSTTKVPATRSRPDYSAFGQATWALADQARFASHLPCLPNANTVTDLMGKVVPGQQWGLGHLENVTFKGGWGPDPSGNYLVRQFGLVTTPNGQMAIAVAAQANSGSFDDGTAILNKIAPLITQHLGDLPVGSCASAH